MNLGSSMIQGNKYMNSSKLLIALISGVSALTVGTSMVSANTTETNTQPTTVLEDKRVTADFLIPMLGSPYSIQYGVTTIDLTDSTGYIYKAGTRVVNNKRYYFNAGGRAPLGHTYA